MPVKSLGLIHESEKDECPESCQAYRIVCLHLQLPPMIHLSLALLLEAFAESHLMCSFLCDGQVSSGIKAVCLWKIGLWHCLWALAKRPGWPWHGCLRPFRKPPSQMPGPGTPAPVSWCAVSNQLHHSDEIDDPQTLRRTFKLFQNKGWSKTLRVRGCQSPSYERPATKVSITKIDQYGIV